MKSRWPGRQVAGVGRVRAAAPCACPSPGPGRPPPRRPTSSCRLPHREETDGVAGQQVRSDVPQLALSRGSSPPRACPPVPDLPDPPAWVGHRRPGVPVAPQSMPAGYEPLVRNDGGRSAGERHLADRAVGPERDPLPVRRDDGRLRTSRCRRVVVPRRRRAGGRRAAGFRPSARRRPARARPASRRTPCGSRRGSDSGTVSRAPSGPRRRDGCRAASGRPAACTAAVAWAQEREQRGAGERAGERDGSDRRATRRQSGSCCGRYVAGVSPRSTSCAIQRSSSARSRADSQRSSGLFARQRRRSRSRLGGETGSAVERDGGSRSRIAPIRLAGLSPVNGRLPLTIS